MIKIVLLCVLGFCLLGSSCESQSAPPAIVTSDVPTAPPVPQAGPAPVEELFSIRTKPRPSFEILQRTLKIRSDLFGVHRLSALFIAYAGSQVQAPFSKLSGIAGGFGGELVYRISRNLCASAGAGLAIGEGQDAQVFWLVGATIKF